MDTTYTSTLLKVGCTPGGYTLHVYTAGGKEGYTYTIHILHFFTLLGGINPARPYCWWGTGIHPTGLLVVAMGLNPHVRKKYRNVGIIVTPASGFSVR
jgi:hypothetical protein